ncbi:MAG TPA: hypothetical protein VE974_29700 [Thermoanaerobaculia bacterium]|nr:hypothetical protein [Thermoanaerobaculia bacterium]
MPVDAPSVRLQPPVGVTAEVRLQPPVGFGELVLRWMMARIGVPLG